MNFFAFTRRIRGLVRVMGIGDEVGGEVEVPSRSVGNDLSRMKQSLICLCCV